jgi:IS5 family transposase
MFKILVLQTLYTLSDDAAVSIDRALGFVRRFTVTDAAAHDGARLASVLDKTNTASAVWADTAYRSKANEAHLQRNGFTSKIHVRRRPGSGAHALAAQGEPGALCC